jgi:acetyl-CoA carboxylase biotin carboxyl carrier protein
VLSDEDVREILRLIDESELDELLIETGDFRLHVLRGGEPPVSGPRTADRGRRTPAAEPAPAAPAASNGFVDVTAPMLGTFYRAEGPGAQPFVEVGAQVEPDTVVCIIEVMKMMNSVPAGVAGTVTEVLAENAELVEFGQPLFRVEPAA